MHDSDASRREMAEVHLEFHVIASHRAALCADPEARNDGKTPGETDSLRRLS
jgi:hypothetical protein